MICSWGRWNTPDGYNPSDRPEGHICYDVIKGGKSEAVVVRNLHESVYAGTDPNVSQYGLRTYVGHAVSFDGACIGSLCTVYGDDFIPTEEEMKFIGLIAAAVGVEELRLQASKRQLMQ